MTFVFSNLLLTKSFKRYLDNRKQIHAPTVEEKETIITPSITPNKAPAAMVKIVGTTGKDKPENITYKVKNEIVLKKLTTYLVRILVEFSIRVKFA